MAATIPRSRNIHVVDHPVVNARLSQLRQSSATPSEFREVRNYDVVPTPLSPILTEVSQGIKQISRFLGFEASRTLESLAFDGVRSKSSSRLVHKAYRTQSLPQETPVAPFTGTVIKPQIGLAPILRAGLGMEDAMLELFP